MSKLDIQATRELCEKAPRRIAMIETGNSHLGYGCSDEEVSCESEHFYDSAIVALPLALDRVEELERECERLRGLVEEALELARYLCSDENGDRYREDAAGIRTAAKGPP